MRNEYEIKPNYARYKLLGEKPPSPFMIQMFHFWCGIGITPKIASIGVIKSNKEKEQNNIQLTNGK